MKEGMHKIFIGVLVVVPLMGVFLAMALLWQRVVFPKDLALLFSLYVLTAMGVTVGYHRMLTHHSFEASPIVRGMLLILGCMAFEGPPDQWAATHIKHHAHSDEEDDPHSPTEGFWHAHFGWLFSQRNFPEIQEYAPHLLEDRVTVFVSRMAPLWMALSLLLPALVGGWTGLLWGGFVRIFLVNHVTWSVNSVCHSFGSRPFVTTDESRNEWIVGLLGFGEGWHNNHHAFPSSAFHGLHWWQLDCSGLLIRFLERTGLAWNVKRVSEEQKTAKLKRGESLSEALREYQQFLMAHVAQAQEELTAFARGLQSALSAPREAASHLQSRIEALHLRYARQLEEFKERMLRRTSPPKRMLETSNAEVRALVTRAKLHLREAARVGAPNAIA